MGFSCVALLVGERLHQRAVHPSSRREPEQGTIRGVTDVPPFGWNPNPPNNDDEDHTARSARKVEAQLSVPFGTSPLHCTINDACGICLEGPAKGEIWAQMPCKHAFHKTCFTRLCIHTLVNLECMRNAPERLSGTCCMCRDVFEVLDVKPLQVN